MFLRNLLLLLSFSIFGDIFAQSSELPNIVPPSPEAASFAKFSETPISLYTGLPNINIPFHSIDLDGLTIPVGISYHARGIKVEEIASRVGVGWALNAGGAITRQIRGKAADEYPNFGYLNNLAYSDFFTNENTRSSAYTQLTNGDPYDMLPDVFHIQAPGLSGKFFINQITGEPMLKAYDDMKIQYFMEDGRISHFVATNSAGFRYYFGKSSNLMEVARDHDQVIANYIEPQGSSYTKNSSPSTFMVFNSWKLMEIKSPKGESVYFVYGNPEESNFFRRSYDKINFDTNKAISYFNEVRSFQYQLREITAANTKIVFTAASSERLDLQGSKALSGITIYNGIEIFKSFSLNYAYSDCIDDSNQLGTLKSFEPQADKRLMLTSVKESGGDGLSKPPFVFEYNPEPLPNRFSNSQDYWGYYNKADNGQFLTFFDYGTAIDRSVDTIASLAGMLEKIRYPTGGSTKFIYEHNRAKPTGDIERLHFANPNPVHVEEKSVTLSQIDHQSYYDGIRYSKPFTVGGENTIKISTDITFGDPQGCSSEYFGIGCRYRIFIYQGSMNKQELYMGQDEIYLAPGNYDLIVKPQGPHDPLDMNDSFIVNLNWTQTTQASSEEILYTSGKRIRRIESYNGDESLISYKEYEYKRPNGESSGAVLGMPNFYSIDESISEDGFVVLKPDGAVPGSPMSTAQGNSIGYGVVTEYFGDINYNIGKVEHEFSITKDNQNYMEYPYHIPNDNEWLRGLPLKTRYYRKEADGTFTLVKSLANNYLYGDIVQQSSNEASLLLTDEIPVINAFDENLTALETLSISPTRYKFPLAIFFNSDSYDPVTGSGIMYKAFYMTGGTIDKVSSIETNFDGPSPVVTEISFGYNYNSHYQNTYIKTSTSDQIPTIQTITYSKELANTSSTIDHLILQNRVVPIERKEYKDYDLDNLAESNELISTVRNDYKTFVLNDLILVDIGSVSVVKENLPPDPRIIYHRYNPSGNPVEVSKAGGPRTVYFWGYNDKFPIAKIENATFEEVAQAMGISITNLYDLNELDLGLINNLRSSLNDAFITTYTYDPLKGVTSITGPDHQTTYYEYDGLGRLSRVKDDNEDLLSENEYYFNN